MKSLKLYLFFFAAFIIIFSAVYLGRPNSNSLNPNRPIKWGVSFSPAYAQGLGLDPKELYWAILNDLKLKNLRLIAYWPEIEPEDNQYFFDELDWQIDEAEKAGAKIILTVGRKTPRWPECHEPDWLEAQKAAKNEKLLEYLKEVVSRYKNRSSIWAWQIENEPFLPYGNCPKIDISSLDREIALIRSLSQRPIIVTDSGEFGRWYSAAKRADIFGTTMYRQVYHKWLGYVRYPLPSGFFRAKERVLRFFVKLKNPIIVSELQAEPWGRLPLEKLPIEEQLKLMDIEKFKEILKYGKDAGFSEYYLWGVEWWYWMKTIHQDSSFWEAAKKEINPY